MRKHPSTIESIHSSTAYRTRLLDPAVLFMPGVSGLRQQLQLANDFQHQFEIVQAGKFMISNPFGGITCPSLPTLSDIQCRIDEEAVQEQTWLA
jgi:hypothetical protein